MTGRENKNLVFFPTALKRKKELQIHKARVKQATQAIAPPKFTYTCFLLMHLIPNR